MPTPNLKFLIISQDKTVYNLQSQKYPFILSMFPQSGVDFKNYVNENLKTYKGTIALILPTGYGFTNNSTLDKVADIFGKSFNPIDSSLRIKALYSDVLCLNNQMQLFSKKDHVVSPVFFFNPGADFIEEDNFMTEIVNKIASTHIVYYYPEPIICRTQ